MGLSLFPGRSALAVASVGIAWNCRIPGWRWRNDWCGEEKTHTHLASEVLCVRVKEETGETHFLLHRSSARFPNLLLGHLCTSL